MPLSVDSIKKRWEKAKSNRQNWEWLWQSVADLVLPNRSFTLQRQPGVQRRTKIYNDTAPKAADDLAGALHGLLTNPTIRWMQLIDQDADFRADEQATEWYYDTTSRVIAYFNSSQSGFSTSSFETYLDLAAFGTAVILIDDEVPGRPLRFQARQLANFYMLQNEQGMITDYFRQFCATARDVVAMFGNDTPGPSQKVRQLASSKSGAETDVEIVHYIYPRDDRDPERKGGADKPWASIYFEDETPEVISIGGFNENPYLTPRWSRAPEEVYGRGPGVIMLNEIRVVNAMSFTQIVAGELMVRPPLIVPANSVEGEISTIPGSMIYVRTGMRDRPEPLNTGVRPDVGAELIERVEMKIKEGFFADRFKLPDNDRMTATEIIERRNQALLITSPVTSRLTAEWLTPAIFRVVRWMKRTGQLLPAPPQIRGRRLKVDYQSPLALSQRSSESTNILQALNTAAPIVAADPRVIARNMNVDATFREILHLQNVNPKLLKTQREVAAILEQEQQSDQQEQQLLQAQAGASAGRDFAAALKDVRGAA